jgi:exoribonuclease II
MPVTAKLLQRLHEALGEEATDDLFTWWEETARVNRAAAREVADLYFARFDARLEKGMTELRAEFRTEMAAQRADLIKWMFIFWAGTVIPLAGLAIALSRL